MKKTSIRQKLLSAFLSAALVPLIILGAFYLANVLETSSQSTKRTIEDKLRIAELLWDVRVQELARTARTAAQDNLLILNLQLGLSQVLADYLETRQRNDKLSFLLVLNSRGEVFAGAGKPYPSPGLQILGEDTLTQASSEALTILTELDAAPFADIADLEFLPGLLHLSVLVVHPVFDYKHELLGYVVAAMAFGTSQERGTSFFVHQLEQRLGFPPVLFAGSHMVYAGRDLASMALPENLADARPGWLSPVIEYAGSNQSYLTMFKVIGTLTPSASPVFLGIAYPQAHEFVTRAQAVLVVIIIIIVVLFASALLAHMLSHGMAKPIVALAEGAREIANGNFTVRLDVESPDEIGLMADEFNIMATKLDSTIRSLAREVEEHQRVEAQVRQVNEELEERVKSRMLELTDANNALAESLAILRRTQGHLVETEKLAALGNLVAGIAHELDTPLGTSLSATSFLSMRIKVISEKTQAERLTKSDLDGFIEEARQVAQILSANLGRVAEQIRFFKQIAIDQETGTSTELDLHRFVEDLNTSLLHLMRSHGHQFVNRVGSEIRLVTLPGPLYQVVTHLVMNALQHGFYGKDGGIISFDGQIDGRELRFMVSDNGSGIPESIVSRIFDPFFTTKRGTGRSGLGLSIVYNLVTVKLGGEISCTSSPGQGASFLMKLPVGEIEQLELAEEPSPV